MLCCYEGEGGAAHGNHLAIMIDAGGEKDVVLFEKEEVVAAPPDDALLLWEAVFWICLT